MQNHTQKESLTEKNRAVRVKCATNCHRVLVTLHVYLVPT